MTKTVKRQLSVACGCLLASCVPLSVSSSEYTDILCDVVNNVDKKLDDVYSHEPVDEEAIHSTVEALISIATLIGMEDMTPQVDKNAISSATLAVGESHGARAATGKAAIELANTIGMSEINSTLVLAETLDIIYGSQVESIRASHAALLNILRASEPCRHLTSEPANQ